MAYGIQLPETLFNIQSFSDFIKRLLLDVNLKFDNAPGIAKRNSTHA